MLVLLSGLRTRFWLFFSLYSFTSTAAILLEMGQAEYFLVYGDSKKVYSANCGNFKPFASVPLMDSVEKCKQTSGQALYEVSRVDYEQSFQALFLYPTSAAPLLLDYLTVEAERESRTSAGVKSEHAKLLSLYSHYLSQLDAGWEEVPLGQSGKINTILYSFHPVFSDGVRVWRVGQFTELRELGPFCDGRWFRASIDDLGSMKAYASFQSWLEKRMGVQGFWIWAWQYSNSKSYVEEKEAYSPGFYLFQLFLSNQLTQESLKNAFQRKPLVFNSHTLPSEVIQPVTSTEANPSLRQICYRPYSALELDESPKDLGKSTQSLAFLSAKYKISVANDFLLALTQFPELQASLGPSFFNKEFGLPAEVDSQLRPKIEEYLGIHLPKRSALLAARDARLKAEALARQAEAQRRANAEAYRTLSNGFSLDGQKWANAAAYEKANPGWKWNPAIGKFEGPEERSRDGGRTWFRVR